MMPKTFGMLQEIQVISNSGLPLLSFNSETEEMGEREFLQAGFLTAVSEFSKEVNQGDLKLIETDSVSYIMKKNKYYTSVFTFNEPQESFSEEQKSLVEVNTRIVEELGDNEYTPADMSKVEQQEKIQRISSYIDELDLSTDKSKFKIQSQKVFENIENLIYRSVGYVPGQCNIGPEGRLRRMTWGLSALVISLVLFITIQTMGLPTIFRYLLFFVNTAAFVGILQSYHRFCVALGAKGTYDMDAAANLKGASSGQVSDHISQRKDRIRAFRIIGEAMIVGALITIVYVLLP